MRAGVDPRRAYAYTPQEATSRLEGEGKQREDRVRGGVIGGWAAARANREKKFPPLRKVLDELGLVDEDDKDPEETRLPRDQLTRLSGENGQENGAVDSSQTGSR